MQSTATLKRYMCVTETYVRPMYLELTDSVLETATQAVLASYEGQRLIRRCGLRRATETARMQALCTAFSEQEVVPVSRYSSRITVVTD